MTRTTTLEAVGFILAATALIAACGEASRSVPAAAGTPGASEQPIDSRSYNLGVIGAFSEVVSYGIKRLALSEALPVDEMAALREEADRIAERHGVSLYLEDDLIVTDLFPADVAVGKQVLLIYTGTTKDDYLALKAEKAALDAEGRYDAEARAEIARRFGRLLSYPEETIAAMLSRSEQ